jgi:CDP-glucose 4,6-dehydratase
LGGYDPYSASKGAAEILIASWRNSFFHPDEISKHGVRLASVRAGNVIGGGDWAKDRIVPDCMRALQNGGLVHVRNPNATRPWQHVLEPLGGYMQLAVQLLNPSVENIGDYCQAFNFGPLLCSNKSVKTLVEKIVQCWGSGSWASYLPEKIFYESSLLHLCIDKVHHRLGWLPKWDFDETVKRTVDWYQATHREPSRVMEFTLEQIQAYEEAQTTPEVVMVSEREVEF